MLIDHMAKGLSFESFAADCNTTKKTLYNWTELFPEFLNAKKRGEEKCRRWWETLGTNLAAGKKKGNAAVYIFNMKNRFGWRDKIETEIVQAEPFKFAYDKEE